VDDDAKCTFSKSNPLDNIVPLKSISLIFFFVSNYISMAKDNKEQKKYRMLYELYMRLHYISKHIT
jgi:hypothetical protein